MKTSPSPYSPGPVLKNRARLTASASSDTSARARFTSSAVEVTKALSHTSPTPRAKITKHAPTCGSCYPNATDQVLIGRSIRRVLEVDTIHFEEAGHEIVESYARCGGDRDRSLRGALAVVARHQQRRDVVTHRPRCTRGPLRSRPYEPTGDDCGRVRDGRLRSAVVPRPVGDELRRIHGRVVDRMGRRCPGSRRGCHRVADDEFPDARTRRAGDTSLIRQPP